MMPVNHVQSHVCHVTVLADAGTSKSNRMLTAVDLTDTCVIVNKHFLNATYSPFKYSYEVLEYFCFLQLYTTFQWDIMCFLLHWIYLTAIYTYIYTLIYTHG